MAASSPETGWLVTCQDGTSDAWIDIGVVWVPRRTRKEKVVEAAIDKFNVTLTGNGGYFRAIPAEEARSIPVARHTEERLVVG